MRGFRWIGACLFLLVGSGAAWAQQCSSSGFGIPFGTVGIGGSVDVTAGIPYQCQANADNTYYKVCLFVPEGPAGGSNDMSGINPRRMTNYNGGTVFYTLYSDAARTQVLGPLGGSYPVYTIDFMVPGGWSQPARTLNVYGRAGPVAAGAAAGVYQAQYGGIEIRYAWSNVATPVDCMQSPGGSANVGFSGATVTVSNACSIGIGQVNDMDFGSTASLASARDNSATITLNCPSNTSWRVGLNDGIHALGAQRRMAGAAGEYVQYELYRDLGRAQRWGNDVAGGSNTVNGSGASQTNPTVLNVYGRVPAQAAPAPGSYSDTVTVTLTY